MRRCINGWGGAIKTDDVTAAQLHTAESASDKREADSGEKGEKQQSERESAAARYPRDKTYI